MTKYNVTVSDINTESKIQQFNINIVLKKQQFAELNEDTLECFNVVLINEYNVERNKKSSFENRAVGLTTIVSTLLSVCINKYNWEIWKVLGIQLLQGCFTCLLNVKVVINLLILIVIINFYYRMYKVVKIKNLENADIIKMYTKDNMKAKRIVTLKNINKMYYDLIVVHRAANAVNANNIKWSFYEFIVIIIVSLYFLF